MATSNSSAGIRWSRQETRTLLSILGEAEYIQRLQTVHHNADVYQAVSKRMQQEGFRRTERQCRSKFKVLKALYLKAYVAHATSMGDPPHCPFYDTLDQLLRNQIVTDADNLMEDAAWAKHSDLNLAAPDTSGEEGTSILGAKRTQAAEHQSILKTVKESDDCQLRVSDQMPETSDLEDSWDESSGAGNPQACERSGSQSHLVISVCLDGDLFSIVAISAPALSFKPNGERRGSRFLKAVPLGVYDIRTLLNLKIFFRTKLVWALFIMGT